MISIRTLHRFYFRDIRIINSLSSFTNDFKPSIYNIRRQQISGDGQQKSQGKTIENKEIKSQFKEDGIRMTTRERLKQMAIVYGPLATVLHIGLSLTFLGITYVTIKFGVDAFGLMEKLNLFTESYMRIISTGSTFGVSYAIYKAMMPLRVMVTIFVTPKVANKLQSMGLIKKRF
ncbi:hypothetical protein BLA29_003197 [Euroglyphus maynei]|uniref:DUF1279 domain-containing protein n=1 Tax=Euroglyphus maynei TaxID=6958 RepID=A0A1Y3BPR2_EURMA|nr:hypothetical protein BLA29_003197 [Euroglyphus maynei]